MFVQNLKQIAQIFVQKLLGVPNFATPQTPFMGAAGPLKFNQLEMVTTCTYRPSLVKIDARNFELSW